MLAKFGKFPFEHFAWGQTLLYYNHMNTVTRDYILEKAWEAQLALLAMGNKCWVGFVEKWALKNQPPRGGRLFASGPTTVRNDTSAYSGPCTTG